MSPRRSRRGGLPQPQEERRRSGQTAAAPVPPRPAQPREEPAAVRHGRGVAFVVSSPSGGGKTTVVRALVDSMSGLRRSISVTTRMRRPGERSRVDYRFVSRPTFLRLREDGKLLEWAQVHRAEYGTLREPLLQALAAGTDVILSLDVQGARAVRRQLKDRAVLIFLLPPSLQALKARLVRRRTESPDAIAQRLSAAQKELRRLATYDYAVVNRRVEQAVEDVRAIVLAERLRLRSGADVFAATKKFSAAASANEPPQHRGRSTKHDDADSDGRAH
ncbi:MAG: guanylate kinase [Candidatus Omnitrophica bacterium]|nr:guanylate kinase [Candidatus Omnitrophota bacterium]